MKNILLAVLLTLTTGIQNAQAVSFSSENLPSALQAELQNCPPASSSGSGQSCFVTDTSVVDIGGMSAYLKYDPYAPDPLTWLIRYSLFSPSNNINYYTPFYADPTGITTVTPYSGSIWLRASNSFNPVDQYHQFTIYADTVSPTPFNYYNGQGVDPNVINLGLTTQDLLAGSGFIHGAGDPSYMAQGSLQRSMWTCVECAWGTDFNLIYLDYSSGSLNFNLNDKRTLLLSQYDSWYGYSNTDTFYVQSVPLPSAFILLGSGLLGLLGLRGRSAKSH